MTGSKSPEIFISFARSDKPYADLLRGYLLARGHDVWTEEDDIQPGEDWAEAITRAVEASRVVLLLLSPGYIASRASLYEAGIALAKQRDKQGKVIPILLGDLDTSRLPLPLRDVQSLDARHLDQKELLRRVDQTLAN
jgi:hypothetical protein